MVVLLLVVVRAGSRLHSPLHTTRGLSGEKMAVARESGSSTVQAVFADEMRCPETFAEFPVMDAIPEQR